MLRNLFMAGLCIAGLAAALQPGIALDRGTALRAHAALDVSAAKKKKHGQYVSRTPQAAYMRRPWMDPSIAADGRPYPNPYPPNVCSVDEGYGRFSPCTFRD